MQTVVDVHPVQQDFLDSQALYRGFVGGRGAGKSFIGALDLVLRSKPGRLYMVAAPTYPMLRDSSLRTFEAIAGRLRFLREIAKGEMIATLGNGAQVLFRSTDNPDRLRGPNLSGAWFDEAGEMDEEAYLIAIACLREAGEQGWLSATFTPRGRQHWTYRVFGQERPDTALFTARTQDNPFNPQGFEAQLRNQYTSAFAEQELAGRFVDLAGTVAKREWFRVVDSRPVCRRMVRAWDFAATPEDGQGRGDYTVGALIGETAAGWCLLDIVRSRVAGGQVMALVKSTAQMDGTGVQIGLEQEPGSSGKVAVSFMVKELAGFGVKPIAVSRDKMTRAMPIFAQAEAGNLSMVRANWNAAFLDEVAAFPSGDHDDQIDAAAHAFNLLHQPSFVGISLPPD